MTFTSILFKTSADKPPPGERTVPDFFVDLNLDQIVAAITAGKEEYDLWPFFRTVLTDKDAIVYRQQVMQDLENQSLFDNIEAFADGLRAMRRYLLHAKELSCQKQKERWFLDAAGVYCETVTRLVGDLSAAELGSAGLQAFRDYVLGYTESAGFTSLCNDTAGLTADLASIRYCLHIEGLRVQVYRCGDEADYGAEIQETFARFKQGAVKEYPFEMRESLQMNHVEEAVLDLVGRAFPEIFARLAAFCEDRQDFADEIITTFDREIQFYIATLWYITRFREAGLNFCIPSLTKTPGDVFSAQCFDLALAGQLIGEKSVPVCNDFHLNGTERIIVVTGPNQGGKTTFARTFGQLHFLASLGCPVPGTQAQLPLFDSIFTHFEREENLSNLQGKLQDDLVRMHAILESATPKSIVIVNEIFASTTFRDAADLSLKIAAMLMERDLYCVWVTFIDALAAADDKTVSMTGTVDPADPNVRTYRIVRRPADGLAYALAIAEKYGLTYDMIRERCSR